jgi:DNA-binding transcriptional LysR family regulator
MVTIIGLVAAGLGVSLAPASVSRLALGGVTYRPVSGMPRSDLVAITRAEDSSPVVPVFIEQIKAHGVETAEVSSSGVGGGSLKRGGGGSL